MSGTTEAKRKHYHKQRVLRLLRERDDLIIWLHNRSVRSTSGAELIKKEERLERVNILLQSSSRAYATGGFSTANKLTNEILGQANTPKHSTPQETLTQQEDYEALLQKLDNMDFTKKQ